MGGNQAIAINNDKVNGQYSDIHITTHGSDWYWTVCACMTVATFTFVGLAATKKRSDRIFHYITAGVTMVAAIAYFTMASNLGWAGIVAEFQRSDPVVRGTTREIFYVRYIDWFITTPLLLTDLMLTAAMPMPTTAWVILIDWVMVVTGLVGALISSSYKWGYYAFGCVALLWIVYVLVWEARIHANSIGRDAGRAFLYCGSLTAFLWILYPIAWGLCEGGNVISPDSEAIFYGILDLLAKPGFGALLLWGHRNISPADLGLAIKDYGAEDPVVVEKKEGLHNHVGANVHSGGVTNGHSTGVTNGNTTTTTNTTTTGPNTTMTPEQQV